MLLGACAVALAAPLSIWSLRNLVLWPVSFAEGHFGAPVQPHAGGRCTPLVGAHRGFGRGVKDQENTESSVAEAIEEGFRVIEIDVIVFPDGVFLDHDAPEVEDARAYLMAEGVRAFPLSRFLEQYAVRFERVVYDFKAFKGSRADTERAILRYPFLSSRDVAVGRRCGFLKHLQRHFGLSAGCELHGALASRLLGFEYLSADVTTLTSFQADLARGMGLRLLLWTLPDAAATTTYCHLAPDLVLVERP